jgi:hypothetical protein
VRLLPSELSSETICRIERRMRPGGFSVAGFLDEEESLLDVVRRDEETLAALGIEPKRIADRLLELLVAANEDFQAENNRVPTNGLIVNGRYHIYGFDVTVRRFPTCPFESDDGQLCDGHRACEQFTAHDFAIVNGITGLRFGFPILALHMITDHHFFEGNVQYRVDPVMAARTLDLTSS